MPSVTARYARFCSPENSYGNVAEVEFVLSPDTRPPNGLSATASDLINLHTVVAWRMSDAGGLISSVLVYRAISPFGPYTVMTPDGLPPSQTAWTDTGIVPGVCYYYKVASLLNTASGPIETPSDYVAYVPLMHVERDGNDLSQLRPGMTVISTHGAFSPSLTVSNIFDGDLTNYADINDRNPAIGVNLAKPYEIHFMRFAARSNQLGRINGAELRGSNDPDYTNDSTRLAVFAGAKVEAFVTLPTETHEAFQYIFVQRPDDGEFYGNLSELELYGIDPDVANSLPQAPVISHSFRPNGKVDLTWTAEGTQDFFRVERSADNGASWTTLGTTAGITFTDAAPLRDQLALYRVTAVLTGPPEETAYSDTYPLYTYGARDGTVLMVK